LVKSDDSLRLLTRHPQEITVSFANQIMHHDKKNQAGIEKILDVKELSDSWRKTFRKRLQSEVREDEEERRTK
jgi:MOSC domain-containing protein YiiM